MDEIMDKVLAVFSQGRLAVLVTLCSTDGSTPRKAGARMLVYPDGSIAGTIGGGAIEYEAMQKAKEIFRSHQPLLWHSSLQDLGMACGGRATVFFEYLDGSDRQQEGEAKI